MIHELEGLVFDNHFVSATPEANDVVLHFRAGTCLAKLHEGVIVLPRLGDFERVPEQLVYLFSIGETRYFLALDDEVWVPDGWSYEGVRAFRPAGPADARFAAVTASQLDRWYRENRFCSCCGHPMELAPESREIVCPACAHIVYPKICPGVICGVTSCEGGEERILLTRYAGRAHARWALVAGYTEIGESAEGTVRREVMEEVGLSVRNITYYKSQPWGFSDTLLMGYWCEADDEENITLQTSELKEARWFSRDEIQPRNDVDTESLTGEMIERFRLLGRAAWESDLEVSCA